MLDLRNQRDRRQLGLFGLILLAMGLLATVATVMVTDDASMSADGAFPEPVFIDPEKRPRFLFPDEVRTHDLSLNRFIDRFFRVCAGGQVFRIPADVGNDGAAQTVRVDVQRPEDGANTFDPKAARAA